MDLVTFIQETIVGGIAGGAAYDGLKMILGNSYDKLASYLQNKEIHKFEAALDMLLSENIEVKKSLEHLRDGNYMQSIIQNNVNGYNIAGNKLDTSVTVGGNSSGIIIVGDNNKID